MKERLIVVAATVVIVRYVVNIALLGKPVVIPVLPGRNRVVRIQDVLVMDKKWVE
jgi:hypothetical protein